MYWNGYIEKVGTGTEDIIAKCHAYGLQTPEFHQEEDFRVVIWRRKNDNADLNVKDFTPYDTPQVTPQVKVLLFMLKDGDKSVVEMMERLGLKDRHNFNERYLQPALSLRLVGMTIPDKPNSRLQRYRLTEKGFSVK
jgi:predicted HTH transcriptional regulator